ncbi:MAG TPA: hypothetical protein VFN66_05730 [Burkholderiales bacterium]|nr:hypothetical protein [Burkholderiales bacterium]
MNKRSLATQAAGAILMLTLSGCGGGSGFSSATPSTPTSLANAILQAEATGAVPKLNHDNTVLGPDVNGNGIRDDIDLYIAAQPDTPAQKAALSQMAVALQASMAIDTTNASARLAVSTKISNGISCLHTVYGEGVASRKGDDIEKITVDTMTRLHAYEKYNQAESGSVFTFPPGDGCGS